ncbi:MAG TPA: hypothetical protein VGA56_13355 [Opitutaceae bacterium]
MSAQRESSDQPKPGPSVQVWINRLASLGPEAQGDIDETLLRENLARTPLERLLAANEAAEQVEELRRAMKAAGHA